MRRSRVGGVVFVDGLRDRALSGENAGRDTYAADRVDGGAGESDSAGVGKTGRQPL